MSILNFFGANMSAVLQPRAPVRKKPAPKATARPRPKQRMPQEKIDELMRLSGALKGAFPDE